MGRVPFSSLPKTFRLSLVCKDKDLPAYSLRAEEKLDLFNFDIAISILFIHDLSVLLAMD